MDAKATILDYIDRHSESLAHTAKEIWDHPQVALQEVFASKLLADELAANGFSIEWGAGHMPTAFVATWGQGAPIIGYLGEYDALPGLSQHVDLVKSPPMNKAIRSGSACCRIHPRRRPREARPMSVM